MGVQVFGDPAGPPVLYCHGWPAGRLEAGLITGLGVSLFSLDRPGYGASDPQPRRRLLDWPDDVVAVADSLDLPAFHVIGVSGGGPYAAAVAAALPDRVRGLALINAVPPADAPGLAGSGAAALFALGRQSTRAVWTLGVARVLLQARVLTPRRIIGAGLPAADRACLTPAVLRDIGRAWRAALRPGVVGAVSDAAILGAPWGFAMDAIRVPTTVWAGADDAIVPPEAASAYAAIPGARIEIVAGEGHYSLPLRQAGRIVAALVGEQSGGRRPPYEGAGRGLR